MTVGTLIALLKLQDEMSPALLDATARLGSFGGAATSAGLALTAGLTTPILGMAYAAVNAGTEFETVMNQIQGVLTPTASEMELVRQTAMRMGADTVFSASEAGIAILELGKAGFTTSEAIAGVAEVMLLAAAAQMDMGAAAEFAAKTIQGFGLDVSDLAHVNDVLAASVNETALNMGDLVVAFGYLGPITTDFGISLEQTAAAMAIMVTSGVPAETAARSLRDALSDMVNPIGQTKDAMEALGIETFKTADGSLMPFTDILQMLKEKGVDATEALVLFGKQSGGPMSELIDAGREKLDELTYAFINSKGAAQEMADAMMSGLPGALEFLRGSIDSMFISLSKLLEPAIIAGAGAVETLADAVTKTLIPAFAELPISVQLATGGVTAFLASLGPFLLIVGGAAFGLQSLITLWGTLVPATAAGIAITHTMVGLLGVLAQTLLVAAAGVTTFVGTLALLDKTGASDYIEYASLRVQQWLGLIDSAATKEDLWNSVLANTARRMGEVDAATANSYEERSKLQSVVDGVTIAEVDLAAALDQATAGLNTNAAATQKLTLAQQAAIDAAKVNRDLYNAWGVELMNYDAQLMAHVELLNSEQIATASAGMAAEQYSIIKSNILPITASSIQEAVKEQEAQKALETQLRNSGMAAFDFSAHVSNNASQMALATEQTGFFQAAQTALGTAINESWNYAAVGVAVFDAIAEGTGAKWAATAANIVDGVMAIGKALADGDWFKAAMEFANRFGAAIADALSQSAGEDIVERVAYDLGVNITEELGDAIAETAEQLFGGDRNAAEIFHLTDLLESAGGLNDLNFDAFASHFRDVFSMLETGMFDSGQAVTVLQENWDTFVEAGIDGSGRLKPELVELMDLTARFASEMADPALAEQFLDQWLVLVEQLDLGIRENFALTMNGMFDMFGLVAEGLLSAQDAADALDQTWDTFVTEGTNKVTGLLDPALQAAVLTMRQLGIESEAVTAYIADQLSGVVDGLNQRVAVFGEVVAASLEDGIGSSERFGFVLEQLQTDAAGLEQEFSNLGIYTVATFGALISEGASLREALDLIGDSLDALAEGEHVLGLEGSAAVDQLLRFREIVNENQAVMESIDGIQKMMTGLANTGYLTQEVFMAFGSDLAAQFSRLIDDGTAANDALLLMQPSLQTLWELQHQFGFEVDASTQALLDQAEGAGLIGAAFQDVMAQIRDILLGIAEALGAELPGYFDQLTDSASSSFDQLQNSYESTLSSMESQTDQTVTAINQAWSTLDPDAFNAQWSEYIQNPGTYPAFNMAGATYTGGYAPGDPRLSNPYYGTGQYAGQVLPTGTMTGSGCCVQIGPIYVMDGTAPSVGSMFLDALWSEIQNGGGMEKFRQMLCEARC